LDRTAVGVIMTQNQFSQEQAFAILARAASTRTIKLRDPAASIIESVGQTLRQGITGSCEGLPPKPLPDLTYLPAP
jgi:hypothetical protein